MQNHGEKILPWSAKNDHYKVYLLPSLTFTLSPRPLLTALTPVESIRSFEAQLLFEERLKKAHFFRREHEWYLSFTGKQLAEAFWQCWNFCLKAGKMNCKFSSGHKTLASPMSVPWLSFFWPGDRAGWTDKWTGMGKGKLLYRSLIKVSRFFFFLFHWSISK